MNKSPLLIRICAVLLLVGLILSAYVFLARPYQLHWGATQEEIDRPMPGDELDPTPAFLATRAITIQGAPEQIFPWLVQMGYGRAGYYGYDIMENLGSPSGLESADHVVAELQNFKVGDKVPISPASEEVFYAIEPDQYLIWAGQTGEHPGGFTWALYPIDENHTRLVSRIRWTHHSITQPWLFSLDLLTEFSDHLAVRKILEGVKGRVEGRIEPMAVSTREFAVFLAALMIFIASIGWILLRPLNRQRWLAGFAAGIGWLITWYAPIPVWAGAIVEILVLIGLYWAFIRKTKLRPSPAGIPMGNANV